MAARQFNKRSRSHFGPHFVLQPFHFTSDFSLQTSAFYFWPPMLRVTRAELLPYLGICPRPETPQVARELHGAPVRCEQRKQHRFTARTDARRLDHSEQVLQL